jgi:DNA-binding transcriptional MocR family regulator
MNPNRLSVESILQALSADKSLVLFNTIALASTDTEILMNKLALSRKQYYSKMSALLRAGLIKRRNKKYFLSSFGKIVYDAQLIIGKALGSYWKLAAIDSFEMSSPNPHFPVEEYNRIIDSLMEGNSEIKNILLRYNDDNITIAGNENPSTIGS